MKILPKQLPKKLPKQLAFTLLTAVTSSFLSAAEIEFHIEGIKQSNGKLMVQLFNAEEKYNTGNFLAATSVSDKSHTATIKFGDIDAGEYALRFFHDENNNGELETNLFGIPTEGYGFSNNAKPHFGPVPYKKMTFIVTEQDSVVINKTHVIY